MITMYDYEIDDEVEEAIESHTMAKHLAPKIKDTLIVRRNINRIRQLSEEYNIPIQEVADIADTFDDCDIIDGLSTELDNYYACYY